MIVRILKTIVNNLICALTSTDILILSIAGALFVALIIVGAVRIAKKRKIQAEIASREVDDDVFEKRGIRYTDDMTIVDKDGDLNISYGKHDCLLKQNQTYIADKKGYVHPGKYTILSTKEGEESFNIRIGVYVKEYHHGQEVVLTPGEEITPVSTDIILR